MRVGAVPVSLLLLCQLAMAGGSVGFNVKWYSTPPFPFNDNPTISSLRILTATASSTWFLFVAAWE
jgi:hypothetical protein